jgi:hypothetical protein
VVNGWTTPDFQLKHIGPIIKASESYWISNEYPQEVEKWREEDLTCFLNIMISIIWSPILLFLISVAQIAFTIWANPCQFFYTCDGKYFGIVGGNWIVEMILTYTAFDFDNSFSKLINGVHGFIRKSILFMSVSFQILNLWIVIYCLHSNNYFRQLTLYKSIVRGNLIPK